jgi:hypothetical protein
MYRINSDVPVSRYPGYVDSGAASGDKSLFDSSSEKGDSSVV